MNTEDRAFPVDRINEAIEYGMFGYKYTHKEE